jgi:hypothetical protein
VLHVGLERLSRMRVSFFRFVLAWGPPPQPDLMKCFIGVTLPDITDNYHHYFAELLSKYLDHTTVYADG